MIKLLSYEKRIEGGKGFLEMEVWYDYEVKETRLLGPGGYFVIDGVKYPVEYDLLKGEKEIDGKWGWIAEFKVEVPVDLNGEKLDRFMLIMGLDIADSLCYLFDE